MKVKMLDLTVRDVVCGYEYHEEKGIFGYDGKLDIRPPYQRNFVYGEKQRIAVIKTILKGLPLNVMYWADRNDGTFEIIDGQQRTISIAQYIDGDFSVDKMYFHNHSEDVQNKIYDYKLMIYLCSGSNDEKLEWFKTVNIAGEKLSTQELRNATYSGTWVSDAKRYFSKTGCVAQKMASDYLKGSADRQEYLETAIKWISKNSIEDYMAKHQHDENALELWEYFKSVINWVEATFITKRPNMKGIDWGYLYDRFNKYSLDELKIENKIKELMNDDEVQKKSGIYPYILTGDKKYLRLRTFDNDLKQKIYDHQSGICVRCEKGFLIHEMEADHITPWSKGGKTTEDNCQMLCRKCNRQKSSN